MKLRDVCEHVCIFVCFVFVLFVNVCHEWAGKLEDVEFLLVLSRIVMSGLRFVIKISGGMVPPPAASCPGISLCTENFCVSRLFTT